MTQPTPDAAEPAKPGKTTFVVINENMLGYVNPASPKMAGILGSSVIKGASHYWKDGMYLLPPTGVGVRPATAEDFDTFRVSLKGYQDDRQHYDAPQSPAAPLPAEPFFCPSCAGANNGIRI